MPKPLASADLGRIGGTSSGLRRYHASQREVREMFKQWIVDADIPPFIQARVFLMMRKAFGCGARKAYRTGYKQAFNRYGRQTSEHSGVAGTS